MHPSAQTPPSPGPTAARLAQPAMLLWVWAPLGWVLGVVMALQQVVLWPADDYGLFGALTLVLIGVSASIYFKNLAGGAGPSRWSPWLGVVVWLSVVALGAASTGWRAAQRQANTLPTAWQGVSLQLTGQVDDLPRATGNGWRFAFRVEGVAAVQGSGAAASGPPAPGQGFPDRVQLSWSAQADGAVPQAGERWRLTVRLRQPHGLANPHGFDSELWLWEQGLGATGYVRLGSRDPAPQRLAPASWGWQPWRERVRQRIQAQVSDGRVAGVLSALVMGDQAAIERRDWDVFRATGVAHLVSISGLHITLWAWLAMRVVAQWWRWAPRLAPVGGSRLLHTVPAPVAAAWGGWVLALGYALFSGWGIPAQRTVLMLAVVMGLRLLGRRWPWPVVGLWAMAVVLAWDPWAWLQAGFWLSFVAVGVLLALGNAPSDPPRPVWGLLRTQAAISVVLAPLTLVLFGQVSVVGLLANLVAIPVVTWLITPLALAGVAWHALWVPAAALVQVLMGVLHAMAAWPGASLMLPALPGWLPVAAVLGGLALVWRWPLSWRALGLALWCPLLLWQAPRPPVGEFEVLAADVGQGSAVVIRTAHGSVLYDAGPQWGPGSDAGQRVLLPLLDRLGERPATVVLSHRDGDHVGGALAVLDAWGPSPLGWTTAKALRVWASFEPPALVSALSDPALAGRVLASPPAWTRCQAGQRWEQDGVVFELLHPSPALYAQATGSNNLSCVLWVRGASRSALLTGDMDSVHEAALVQAHPGLRADWLLAPHHGSRTSSSAELLDTVRPQWVVVQAGYLSRYGHPAPQVLDRYRAHGVRWVATPECGAALWRSTQPDAMLCQRQSQPRHWHWRPPVGADGGATAHPPSPGSDASAPQENP